MKKDWNAVIGEKHNLLTILSRVDCAGPPTFLVKCDCGNTHTTRYNNLQQGSVKSCGCLSRSQNGLSNTPIYAIWNSMIQRCTNPKNKQYAEYGGRGIGVATEWLDYRTFLADMGEPPFKGAMLERTDNSLGYSKVNCVWADRTQQNRNKRNNKLWEYGGRSQLLIDWASEFGINYRTLVTRVYNCGWDLSKALTTPVKGAKK